MNSVLRWAGSKRKLLHQLRAASPRRFHRYIEPFAGSAVLFFDLAPASGVLGDLNPEVVTTYESIRDTPDELLGLLHGIPKNAEAYYLLRSLDPSTLTKAQRGARLLFLVKACFNGVYRTNMNGQFNVPLGNKFFALPSTETVRLAPGGQVARMVDVHSGKRPSTYRSDLRSRSRNTSHASP